MKIIDPFYEIIQLPEKEFILNHIEGAARTCYRSEDKIGKTPAADFLKGLIKSGHHSVFEHAVVTVRVICDRGISHELVRHRLCSFSQESTRYANYSKDKFGNEITVIRPFFWEEGSTRYTLWKEAVEKAEAFYLELIGQGASAQEARSVLPNSLKTELVVTANLREWRHIFDLRCAKASHPQIRQIMLPMLREFKKKVPVVFDDLFERFDGEMQKFPSLGKGEGNS